MCKLSALIILLSIGFIYKVPVAGKHAAATHRQQEASMADSGYLKVHNSQPVTLTHLYERVVHSQETNIVVSF